MSKKNKSHSKLDGNNTAFVDKLVKENSSLKKKIGKLRKIATKAVELDTEETDATPYESEKTGNFKQISCELCGGAMKKVVVAERAFNVCQSCKHRVKLEEKIDTLRQEIEKKL
jgi:formamidopyrimidine-DNA glycosylase